LNSCSGSATKGGRKGFRKEGVVKRLNSVGIEDLVNGDSGVDDLTGRVIDIEVRDARANQGEGASLSVAHLIRQVRSAEIE